VPSPGSGEVQSPSVASPSLEISAAGRAGSRAPRRREGRQFAAHLERRAAGDLDIVADPDAEMVEHQRIDEGAKIRAVAPSEETR
jgi:hypothetical protein